MLILKLDGPLPMPQLLVTTAIRSRRNIMNANAIDSEKTATRGPSAARQRQMAKKLPF